MNKQHKIVFWFNVLSPHQMPYIKHMAENPSVQSVIVCVPELVSKEREKMGWLIEKLSIPKLEVVVNPTETECETIFSKNTENSFHFFSGIRGFPFVFTNFKRSLKYNIKRGIITEMPLTFFMGRKNAKPLWMHKLRFKLLNYKYVPHISYVFAIGQKAKSYYCSISSKWEVYPFIYCTEQSEQSIKLCENRKTKFAFVGSLSIRKNPLLIVNAMQLLPSTYQFIHTFIGDGSERLKLEKKIKKLPNNFNLSILGFIPNNLTISKIRASDILILPSIFDGWGAVVNEALQCGLFVICSDACGAKELIKDKQNGIVFKSQDPESLKNALVYVMDNIKEIRQRKLIISEWAGKSISGKVLSDYFLSCIENKKPDLPWEKPL